jgi:hypothetical protein
VGPERGVGEGAGLRRVSPATPTLLIAAAALVLAACGLEIVPDLDLPGIPTPATPSTPVFHVVYEVTLVPEFRGFEVYYKFSSSDQPLETGFTVLSQLEDAGFKRMCSPGVPPQGLLFEPLIPVNVADRNTGFTIDLDFGLVVSPYMDYHGTVPPPENGLRRSAVDTVSETKMFDQGELDPGDADLMGVNWTQVGSDGQLFLVAYALSYGVYDLTRALYSDAQCLGYMRYNF